MKIINTRDAELTPRARGAELIDPHILQLCADYVRAHGYPQGPLSTLTPDCRIQTRDDSQRALPQ